MLVSIAKVESEVEKAVARRLFKLGDVNAKTRDNGQTALMLAASHGKLTTVKLLLDAGADVNIQDKVRLTLTLCIRSFSFYNSPLSLCLPHEQEGSTALMCAADNGHSSVVKLLLCHFDTDVNIKDNVSSVTLFLLSDDNNSRSNIFSLSPLRRTALTRYQLPSPQVTRISVSYYTRVAIC